ncbi:MAG: efflux transporter outer membrane subunit [Deltaproteobacteria bacterium]|nr:efflux transporter outer membrane subunit [Deltaproteobacteria bacterium]
MRRLQWFPLPALLLLAGCALTPDYERPALDLPPDYIREGAAGESVANLPWWDLFADDRLRELVEVALVENKDLGAALARVAEAQRQVTVTRADQFPFIDIMGGAGRGRGSQQVTPGTSTRDSFDVSAGLTFEIDLWRKLARSTEAARADLLATEAAFRNVTITLVANVANTYLQLRDLDARLSIARRTVEGRRDSLAIIEARFEKGTVPELDVNQAQIELAIAEVAAASFERGVQQTETALRVLLGRNPGPIIRGLALETQALPVEVPAGLPSELLQRRPDVVAAEEQLIAETARIGVAEALRYPAFSLTAGFGTASDTLSQIDFNEAKAWSLASAVLAPIFNSGKLKAQANAQRSRAEQAMRAYEGTLLQALREVEDSLVAVRTLREEHQARTRQVVAARNAARLSRARYDGGVVDYLEVLESERSLFNAELEESRTLGESLTAVVTLYKALGGGWNP